MTQKWTTVALKGKAQVIPPVCPNCLGEGSVKYRYGYRGLQGWLTRTTYYQTFTYCPDCQRQAASAMGLRRWVVLGIVLGFIAWISLLVFLVDRVRDPQTGKATDFQAGLSVAVATAAALAVVVLVFRLARALKRRRHPLRPGQAVWGLAAFYTGGTHFGFSSGSAVYKAVRPEWIAALVKANPEQVADAVYQNLVGAARPAPVPGARPFGPN
jgi:hypothetical protein